MFQPLYTAQFNVLKSCYTIIPAKSSKRRKRIPTDQNAPHMVTIKELAEKTAISESHIRKLCKTDKIPYIRTGVKYLINYNRFIDYLNGKI